MGESRWGGQITRSRFGEVIAATKMTCAGEGQAGTLVYGGDENYVHDGIAVTSWRHWPTRIVP